MESRLFRSRLFVSLFFACFATSAIAEQLSTSGTLLVIPASGRVTRPNDMVVATLLVEERDKDKGAAASRVNSRMSEGTAMLKKLDPSGKFETRDYFTYAVYAEEAPGQQQARSRPPVIGWRVGQYLEYRTKNLGALQKNIAAVQKILGLNGLKFGLAPETQKAADEDRIAAAYLDLHARIRAAAKAMGRSIGDASLELVDFERASARVETDRVYVTGSRVSRSEENVAEPSFEPGESTLETSIVGKVKFK
jgi:uncharacterized protein YggE